MQNDYAFEGSDVQFTCSYDNPENLAAPSVTWTATLTKGGDPINVGDPNNKSAGSGPVSPVVRVMGGDNEYKQSFLVIIIIYYRS